MRILWTDNFWVMSHSQEQLKHILKDLTEKHRDGTGLGAETCKPVVVKHIR